MFDDFDYYDWEPEPEFFDDGKFYTKETWYEDHLNPPGTEDCGDGYLTGDGIFIEY